MSYLVQADGDGDGKKDVCQSKSTYRLGDAKAININKPATNLGAPKVSGDNPVFGAPSGIQRA
jgi:hypothetical protein